MGTALKLKEHVGLRNKELAESNEWRGWKGGKSAGDRGGNCCGEGECMFCPSLLPVTASALPSLPGMLSYGFPQGHRWPLPAAVPCFHLVLPVVSTLFRMSCSG